MTRNSLLTVAVVTVALASGGGAPAVSHDDDHGKHNHKRDLRADLRGSREVPAVSTDARGSFRGRISRDGTEISWRLRYRDLLGAVSQAHIHFGDHHTNGGISVWFCANNPPITNAPAGTPACPPAVPGGDEAELTGSFKAEHVVGPAGQGIAAGEFEELIRAIRSGLAYANVHTAPPVPNAPAFPGGEIRGQIKLDD